MVEITAVCLSKTLDISKIAPKSCGKGIDFPLLLVIEVFLLKPVFVAHADYQRFVLDQLRQHYTHGLAVLVPRDWPIIWKCLISDLSYTAAFLRDSYADKGPAPRDPASMLRSYLLFLLVRPEIGITAWVDEMYRVPLYSILSGFEPGDIPGVGTFYDFLARFWASEVKNLKPKNKPKKRKPKRGKKVRKLLQFQLARSSAWSIICFAQELSYKNSLSIACWNSFIPKSFPFRRNSVCWGIGTL